MWERAHLHGGTFAKDAQIIFGNQTTQALKRELIGDVLHTTGREMRAGGGKRIQICPCM